MIFNLFLGIVTDLMNVQDPLSVCELTTLDKLVAKIGGTLWVWANEVGSFFTQAGNIIYS